MIKDILGVELRVGDVIAYPGRRGSRMWMNVGSIVNFGSYKYLGYDDIDSMKTIIVKKSCTKGIGTITRIDRVVKVANGTTPAISRSIAFTRHSFPKGEMPYPLAAMGEKHV